MNERIKLLAEQAEKYADANFKGEPFWTEAYESKFAELLLHDVMSICEEQGDKGLDGHYCVDKIRKEFGV
jgi:hypothetical protein